MVYVTYTLTILLPIGLAVFALNKAYFNDRRREREYWERTRRWR